MTSFNDSKYNEQPNMDPIDYIFYYTCVILAPIVFVVCLVSLFLLIRLEWKRFHPNFCILHLNLIFAFIYVSIANFTVSFLCLKENTIEPKHDYDFYMIAVMLGNFGATLLRCLWIAIFIERTIATIYRDFYETKNQFCLALSIILMLTSYGISILIEYSRFYLSVDLNYTQSFALIMDLVAIFINENVRVLKIILPILTIGVIMTMVGTILIWVSFKVEVFLWAFRYTSMIYFIFLNLYAAITLLLWVKNDPSYRSFLSTIIRKKMTNHTVRVQPLLVNVEGKIIQQEATPESHFAALQNMWSRK